MNSSSKGNRPEEWQKLLDTLDEKLQFGLLDHLRRVESYHIEEEVLFIVPGSAKDEEYLRRSGTLQHLELLAQDSIHIERVKIRSAEPGDDS